MQCVVFFRDCRIFHIDIICTCSYSLHFFKINVFINFHLWYISKKLGHFHFIWTQTWLYFAVASNFAVANNFPSVVTSSQHCYLRDWMISQIKADSVSVSAWYLSSKEDTVDGAIVPNPQKIKLRAMSMQMACGNPPSCWRALIVTLCQMSAEAILAHNHNSDYIGSGTERPIGSCTSDSPAWFTHHRISPYRILSK